MPAYLVVEFGCPLVLGDEIRSFHPTAGVAPFPFRHTNRHPNWDARLCPEMASEAVALSGRMGAHGTVSHDWHEYRFPHRWWSG